MRIALGSVMAASTAAGVLVGCGSDGPASPVDRAASWLESADHCDHVAHYDFERPGEAGGFAPQIPALTSNAQAFTALSCRAFMRARGNAAVWAFTSVRARDAAIGRVERSDRAGLCRLDHVIVLMQPQAGTDPARAFCRSVDRRLG